MNTSYQLLILCTITTAAAQAKSVALSLSRTYLTVCAT